MRSNKAVVCQSVNLWLPLTSNWLYNHLDNMEQVLSVVIARKLVEPERFPWQPLYVPDRGDLIRWKISGRIGGVQYPTLYDKAIQKHQPQLLHSHFGNIGWQDLPLVHKHGLKHIVTFYGLDVNMLPTQDPMWRTKYRELFSRADLFLCEGPYMAGSLVDLGCPEEKVQVQRLGVMVEQIDYVPRILEKNEPIKILISGSFREKKGIPYALEAVGQLRSEDVDVQVTIIGDSDPGFEQEKIEKQKILDKIEKYDLQPVTRLLGYQPHDRLMAEAYQHHVFLSPSVTASNGDTEGGAPVTIVEMAASGMPIVSSKHCDIPHVIIDGQTGWLAEERDVHGLVEHLKWLVDHPHTWRTFTDRGRKHIEENFDVRVQASLLEKIYCQVISEQ
jgi:colanic acid/amylovoran biosynthesis glycosyltransferase